MKKRRDEIVKNLLLAGMFLLMTGPFINNRLNIIDATPLRGAVTEPVGPEFSADGWFSGEFQVQNETYLNEAFGLRSVFVRLNNQIAYTFFSKAKANGVIIGKDNYLFEEDYIRAFNGTDFIGVDSTVRRMKKLKYVQDELEKRGKTLLVVFAAGKGSFYPEYFPDDLKHRKGITNYQLHSHLAQYLNINHIDFNAYFLKNKSRSEYPLYPKCGIHWSYYGSCLAADSMICYIERKRNIDMPDLRWDSIEVCQPKFEDYDIGDGMNMLFRIESFDMAYPKLYTEDTTGKSRPSLIVVSDSYYWEMFNYGFPRSFGSNQFWYYNKQVYPDYYNNQLETSQVDLAQSVAEHDVFIIMGTEATLPEFGWGFIERLYDFFSAK